MGFPPDRSPAQVSPVTGGVGGRKPEKELKLRRGELDGGGRPGPRGKGSPFYFGKGDGVADTVQANQKVSSRFSEPS